MTLRNFNPTLAASLLENDEFVYAHLVKFEKPLKTSTGDSGQRANDYSCIRTYNMYNQCATRQTYYTLIHTYIYI